MGVADSPSLRVDAGNAENLNMIAASSASDRDRDRRSDDGLPEPGAEITNLHRLAVCRYIGRTFTASLFD